MHPDQEVNTTQFDAKHQPPRCRYTLLSGQTCGQPALSGRDLCRFHQAVAPSRREFILPIVEDAASLQLALNRVMRALTDDLLTYKKASLLLYALQIAASNFKRLRQEMQEVTDSAANAKEESWVKELLEVLQIPETEAERIAEETAAEMERNNPPPGTFTIKACAGDDRSQPHRSPTIACPERSRGDHRPPGGAPTGASFDEMMHNFEVQRDKAFALHVCAEHPRARVQALNHSDRDPAMLRSKCLRVHFPHVEKASQKAQAPSQEENQNRVKPVSGFWFPVSSVNVSSRISLPRADGRSPTAKAQRSVSSGGSKSAGWLRTRNACAASSTRTHRRTPPMALE